MGLAVSAIKTIATKGVNYARRGAKVYLPTVFGEGGDLMAKAYKGSITTKNVFSKEFWANLWKGTKEAGKAAERYSAKVGGNKAFFKNMWKSLKGLPAALGIGAKAGARAARIAGKSPILGATKGIFRKLGTKMPLIGSLLILAFEAPNIIKATKEKGIIQGIKETLKAGAKLGGMTIGMAIGTALGGPLGGLVGAIAGDWLAGKIVGKSYSEKVAEQEAQVQEQENADAGQQIPSEYNTTNPFATKYSEAELALLRNMLYSQHDMFNPQINPGFNYMA